MNETAARDHAIALYERGGEEALVRHLGSYEDCHAVMELCAELLVCFYWQRKDLQTALKCGRHGIDRYLESCSQNSTLENRRPSETDLAAKRICYNMASFTWPGWDEQGISIGQEELGIGHDAARMNLQLARDWQRGPLAEARAHWMLACHLLARNDHAGALEHFASSVLEFQKVPQPDEEQLARGFHQLTRILGGDSNATRELESTLMKLSEFESGSSFVSQIETARRYFNEASEEQGPPPK